MVAVVATDFPRLGEAPALAQLGAHFQTPVMPAPLAGPYWVARNPALARELGVDPDWLASDAALAVFSGDALLPGSAPFAAVYSGHQFGVWAGQLGDGRALTLGQLASSHVLQLKGSGRTPYSRGADGRAVLRSSIREFLCSAAMHALGIPTTRALCVVGADVPVLRETVETAAIVTRTAPSLIRFGTFEHFSHTGAHDDLKRLADAVIARDKPECLQAPNPYAALLAAAVEDTAALLAQWQAVGFMHGVMNTDNMSILGLTLDYGPFQFMDAFDPAHICNHSDTYGRYAYQNQPAIAHWNLCALATALMPLIQEADSAQQAVDCFAPAFTAHYQRRMTHKLGFAQSSDQTAQLAQRALELLASERTDYPIFWRRLTDYAAGKSAASVKMLFTNQAAVTSWLQEFDGLRAQQAHSAERMQHTNPVVVLRNYLAEEVIVQAKLKNFGPLQALLTALQHPFELPRDHPEWAGFPPEWSSQIQISCSS